MTTRSIGRGVGIAGVLAGLGLAVGCGGAPARAPSRAPDPSSVATHAPPARVHPELRFVDAVSGGVFFELAPDGTLRVGAELLGVLGADGVFTFAGTLGAVTARIAAEGRVVIAAVEGTDLATVRGDVGKLLRAYQGRIASAYVIDPDGVATAPTTPPLVFDDAGQLQGTALSVPGLAARDRRIAMFAYVLLTMLIA